MDLYKFIKDGKLDFEIIEEVKELKGYRTEESKSELLLYIGDEFIIKTLYKDGVVRGYRIYEEKCREAAFNAEKILCSVYEYKSKKTFLYSKDGMELKYSTIKNKDKSTYVYVKDSSILKSIELANGGRVLFYKDGVSVKYYQKCKGADLVYFTKFRGKLLGSAGAKEIERLIPIVKQVPEIVFLANKDEYVNEMSKMVDESKLSPVPEGYKSFYTPRYIRDEDIPQLVRKLGGRLERKIIDIFVEFDEEKKRYKYSYDKEDDESILGSAVYDEISIHERRFLLKEDDYNKLEKIELDIRNAIEIAGGDEKAKTDVLKKLDEGLYRLYKDVIDNKIDIYSTLYHEQKHIVDNALCLYSSYSKEYKLPSAREKYKLIVEIERVAYLETLNKAIKKYFTNGNDLCSAFMSNFYWVIKKFKGCSAEEIKEKLYPPTEIMNEALQRWNDNFLDDYYMQFKRKCLYLSKESLLKQIDRTGKEYRKQLSYLYTFEIYNPVTKKDDLLNLSQVIDVEVPITQKVVDEIIAICKKNRKIAKQNLNKFYSDPEDKIEVMMMFAFMEAISLDSATRKKLDDLKKWMETAVLIETKLKKS